MTVPHPSSRRAIGASSVWTHPTRWSQRARCSCREGWDVAGRPISVEAVPSSNGHEGAEVRVETSSPDGKPVVYEVAVEVSGTVEYIKCIGREDEGTEEEAQYTVARVEKVR